MFRRQYGVAGRSQLRLAGVTARIEEAKVGRGEWERPTPKVVRLAGSARVPEQELMIALLEVGSAAIASHQSAAWLWRMAGPPRRHAVTLGGRGRWRPGPFVVHRIGGEVPAVVMRGTIPCTNPVRTLVDLAGVVASAELDEAVDRAVAARLVTVEALRGELLQVGQRGRKGAGVLRAALRRRGLAEGLHPSVLEARFHRLLKSGGITPISVETVAGVDGGYRLDCLLDELVAAEVDGHVHHSTPEQKAYDERRRAEIRMAGRFVLVFGWRDVVYDGRRVLAECHQALARYGSARRLAN